jgi:hypothetical protein
MKGDFSKWGFNGKKNFNGVLHQQGRVLLDNDWNAQTEITNDWQDQAARDAIGSGVAAIPAGEPDGFKVISANSDGKEVKITVKFGRAWVDGLLVYLNGEKLCVELSKLRDRIKFPDSVKDRIRYDNSKLFLIFNGIMTEQDKNELLKLSGEASYQEAVTTLFNRSQENAKRELSRIATYFQSDTKAGVGRDALILEVWREEINGFQLPDELIEPALGGPDTTERVHTAAAFRLLRLATGDSCNNIRDKLKDYPSKKGKLKVSLQPTTTIPGDCPVVEGGGYTGFEHNFYRIEIAQVKSGSPTMFKWSQFNGGLVGRGKFDASEKKVEITANLQPIITSGLDSFYLEAVEYDQDFGYWRVTYGAEVSLNTHNEIKLPDPGTEKFGQIPVSDKAVFFRLWNGIEAVDAFSKITAPVEPEEWRDGIRLEFDNPSTATYVPGDYWTFPVRAGEIANEEVLIDNKTPDGICYHRVPLAILNWNSAKDISFDKKEISDCRDIFRPLISQTVCCSFIVGDGKSSHGDFDSIEEALSHLPDSGGEICLLPGLHEANVSIEDKRDIKIRGCDKKTMVRPSGRDRTKPIFTIRNSEGITLEHMDLVSLAGMAIKMEGSKLGKLKGIEINGNRIQALINAIHVEQGTEINIHHNRILMYDKEGGDVAIYMMGEDSVIEGNDIGIIPAVKSYPPPHIPGVEVTPSPVDPCTDAEEIYRSRSFFGSYARWLWNIQPHFLRVAIPQTSYKTPGGIQIAGASERIRIIENRVSGGSWNGITLGNIPSGYDDISKELREYHAKNDISADELNAFQNKFKSFLYDIVIEENEIRNMGLNGIGVIGFFNIEKIGLIVSVIDLTIYHNHIENCLQQVPKEIPTIMKMKMGFGGISLSDCENLIIRENRIENNGKSHIEPISGIFILHGEKIDISDNRILNNGPRSSEKDEDARPGMRGGIIIAMGFKNNPYEIYNDKEFFPPDGIPAVKIHDNIVTQPLGQALFIIALGPVSVIGNHLTSQGADFKVNPLSKMAGSVFILNLGISKDLIRGLLFPSFKNMPLVSTRNIETKLSEPTSVRAVAKLLYMPSGNVLFANNQATLDLRSPEIKFALSSQLIASLDDVSYVGNQSECTSVLDIVIANAVIYAVTIRTNDNRFQEGITQALYSLFSYGFMNTCTTNQATHCLHVFPADLPYGIFSGNIILIPQATVLAKKVTCEESREKLKSHFGISAKKGG